MAAKAEGMLTEAEIEFLRAKLDEDEAAARAVENDDYPWLGQWDRSLRAHGDGTLTPNFTVTNTEFVSSLLAHFVRHAPARVLREVAVWRRLLLEYQTAPLDAAYGGTERETGFRLALSAALKAKIATYEGNPVTGHPFPVR